MWSGISEYCLCQGEGCGLQWVWLRGVVYSGHFDWLLGGIVAAAEMRMRSVWVEVESGDNLVLSDFNLRIVTYM